MLVMNDIPAYVLHDDMCMYYVFALMLFVICVLSVYACLFVWLLFYVYLLCVQLYVLRPAASALPQLGLGTTVRAPSAAPPRPPPGWYRRNSNSDVNTVVASR